jgi:hypothetical protein
MFKNVRLSAMFRSHYLPKALLLGARKTLAKPPEWQNLLR